MELIQEKYKQTEVGVIPSDWEIKTLGEISKVISGGTPSTSNSNFFGGNINWFTPTEIGKNKYSYESLRKLTILGLENSSATILPIGTIILTTRAGIGDVSILAEEASTNQGFQSFIVNMDIYNEFLYYLISTLKNTFHKNASGSTFLEISPNKIKSIQVAIPKYDEQTKIAKALSDADDWIKSLEQLLTKKRQIKQGAVQELLKPKQDWEVKKLGEIVEILDNLRKPLNDADRQKMKGNIPYCGANGIVGYVNNYVIDDEIILMAEDGGYFDEYKTRPIAYKMKGKCWVNNHAHILKSKRNINQDFIFFSLVNKNILDFINGGTRAKLNKGELINISISIPKTEEEQTRISTILSDMDIEIEQLKIKIDKAKKVKQGMMQELLTGKTRLV